MDKNVYGSILLCIVLNAKDKMVSKKRSSSYSLESYNLVKEMYIIKESYTYIQAYNWEVHVTRRLYSVRKLEKSAPQKMMIRWGQKEQFLLARERRVKGERSLQDRANSVDKCPVWEGTTFQIERQKSDECHWNSDSEEQGVRGVCRGKWGPHDTGFWEPC